MEAREFYDKRINEDSTIGSVQLMEEYAKHIIEVNFCDGTPVEFEECSIPQLKDVYKKINGLIDWMYGQ